MSGICGASEAEKNYDRSQASLLADQDMIRADRFKEDRRLVRANAALLLSKQVVKGKRTQWAGPVYLGSKECSWDYLDVVGRASEHDDYFLHVIDLSAPGFTTHLTAARRLKEILQSAALEIAFDSLDIGDIWGSVEHLMEWERDQ